MISIIIPSLGRPSLERLVKSLQVFAISAGLRANVDFEILISLDTRAVDPSFEATNGIHSFRGTRPGVNYARNEGARRAKGEVLWFLDDDTELIRSESFPVLRTLFQDETVEAAGGDYISGNEASWSERGYNLFCSFWRNSAGESECEQLLGGTLAVRKRVWKKADGFDESIEYGGAETAFVQKIRHDAREATPKKRVLYLCELDVRHGPGERGFRKWMTIAYLQGGRRADTAAALPPFEVRVRRAFRFLKKQDVRAWVALTTFALPYLIFSYFGRVGTKLSTVDPR